MRVPVVAVAFASLFACSPAPRSGDTTDDAAPPLPIDAPECTHDTDCPAGHICTADHCVLGCNTDQECGAGRSCCDHACIPTDGDPANCGGCGITCGSGGACCTGTCSTLDTLADCGACGNACGSGDFCDGSACQTPTFPSFCANAQVYEVFDGQSADINAAALMTSTISENCSPSTMITTTNITNAAMFDQTTGQPLGGNGVTYVLTGGPEADKAVKYFETTAALTHVYFAEPSSSTFAWMARGSATPVATLAASSCSAHADQFVVELVTDPATGTLSLIGYGICTGAGTFGAAYYYANVMLPNAMMFPDSWYVVSWADTTNDGVAGNGDTFTVLAHGM